MTDHGTSYELAVAEAERGNWEAAERYARAAVTIGGERYAACLGKILAQVGKYDEARSWLLRALELQPADPDVLFFLGGMNGVLGMREESVAYFDQALVARPDFPAARWSRDRILKEHRFLQTVQEALLQFAENTGRPVSNASELGDIEFPSTSRDVNGQPRFRMSLPASLILSDLGAAALFYSEVTGSGYEPGLRGFIELHLASDDVFIDVGAHWGIHSLTAATVRRREVSVLAVEAHPENATRLGTWVRRNQLEEDVEIIPYAIADRKGVGQLAVNGSSMGHTMRKSGLDGSPHTIDIKITTLDRVLKDRPHLHYRPIILKLDVEGCEIEALTGARILLSSGTVRAVIWEKGLFEDRQGQSARNQAVLELLGSHGFEHFYFPDPNRGALVPLEERDATCNVYSLAPGLERKERYF